MHEFITANRDEIIARCRAKISSRPAPRATDLELEYGVPMFLDQLTHSLRLASGANAEISTDATKHGNELLRRGFTVRQVVQDYGGIGQAINELAGEKGASFRTDERETLATCLDEAIAGAVTEYGRLREHEGTERLGRLAHDLRNHLNSALLSYEMLVMGSVPIASSTGLVLARSLMNLRNLIDRELTEVRLRAGEHELETIRVSDLIEDIEVPAAMEANARGLHFSVISLAKDVTVRADRPILKAMVANLLQNAFKFTQPKGHVVLRTHAATDRVLFEIEDQCGGLAPGQAELLLLPAGERATERKRGLGLEICARGARIHDALLSLRDQPNQGCVFTLDLPCALAM